MFHLVLSATVATPEQHNKVFTEMGTLQDGLAGEIPSINLSSYDMTSEIPEGDELYLAENTMFKVLDAIKAALPMSSVMKGEDETHARDIIQSIQNAGILFRELRRAIGESGEEEGDRSEALPARAGSDLAQTVAREADTAE